MNDRISRYIGLATFILSLTLLGTVGWRLYGFLSRYADTPFGSGGEVSISIPRGATFTRIARMLHEAGVVENPLYFRMFAMFGSGIPVVKAGQYTFSRPASPVEVLRVLRAGPKIHLVRVTVPEGKNILEVSQILAGAGLGDRSDFLSLMRDKDLAAELGVKGPSLEGYLFPETYKFRRGSSPKEILSYMVKMHHRVWARLIKEHPRGWRWLQTTVGFGHHEAVIMASLVEKETGVPKERGLIAGVFYNRLLRPDFKPKLLQTDPTIIYGCTVPLVKSRACRKFHGRIRRIHLVDRDNPYSTYTHEGLPPGPICSPGRAALLAAIKPTPSDYLYFVAKTPGGEHYFSRTREEHERAVDRYIRKKR